MPKIVQDRINWDKIANAKWPQKLAIKEAVKKIGNCHKLSMLIKKDPAMLSKWINKKLKTKSQDVMHPASAMLLQRVAKIKGLAIRLCPSLKP